MASDRTERLLNLVICLLGAPRPVGRATLREVIPGYSDTSSDEAFERMFERDKDELRQMGIPIDTVVNAQGEVEGYLIDPDAYALPDIQLDPAELAVLGLASRTWAEAALAAEAAAALRKIEARTGEMWTPRDVGPARPGTGEEWLPTLWEAIRSRRPVTFDYLARGRDEAATRVVEPWATVHRDGAWYLVGRSRERGEGRAFRLSRIQGRVTQLRETTEPPVREEVEAVAGSIAEPHPRGTARLRLPARGAARLRQRARPVDVDHADIDYADADQLVSDAIEAGAVIVSPPDVAQRQRDALQRVAEAHGG